MILHQKNHYSKMIPELINNIFEKFNIRNNNPKTELNFTNHYNFLVAIILSARATDVQVNKATKDLFVKIHAPQDMLRLGEDNLVNFIKSIGLYRSKAKNILALSQILITKYNSKIPVDFDKLKALPGIGSKTAKVFLNTAFHKPVIAVDTHVFRVARRLGLTQKESIAKVEEDLEAKIPGKWKQNAHHWLVLHGRYICKARTPICNKCFLSQNCQFFLHSLKLNQLK